MNEAFSLKPSYQQTLDNFKRKGLFDAYSGLCRPLEIVGQMRYQNRYGSRTRQSVYANRSASVWDWAIFPLGLGAVSFRFRRHATWLKQGHTLLSCEVY